MEPALEILNLYARNGLRPWLLEEIAPHLSRWEIICRCGVCFRCTLSPELKRLWSRIRDSVGTPLNINSGVRCQAHQRRVNPAVSDSMHLYGEALDIRWPEGMQKTDFYRLLESAVGSGGIGVYSWGVHVDTGKNRYPNRRWGSVPE
jgi:uncharacterized protein YcbK (DUF882 family)